MIGQPSLQNMYKLANKVRLRWLLWGQNDAFSSSKYTVILLFYLFNFLKYPTHSKIYYMMNKPILRKVMKYAIWFKMTTLAFCSVNTVL